MKDDCQRYLEDPEAHAAHPETCAECAALALLDAESADAVAPLRVDPASLPVAPWEGASHRAWPLVLGGLAGIVILALALCAAAGLSPVHVAESSLVPVNKSLDLAVHAGNSLRAASAAAQIGFGVAFVVVNALLFVLLRRAPRGIDA